MARLLEEYNKRIKQELLKEGDFKNPLAVPSLEKIMINVGAGEALTNSSALDDIVEMVTLIAGQKPIVNKSKKAVSSFKLRKGEDIGVSVTLRGERMWEFFDKLINVALPRVKDFRGLNPKSFDGAGNYSIGLDDQTVFIEIDPNNIQKVRSLQITIVTTAKDDKSGKMLLDKFGFPFTKDVNRS